MKNKPVLLIIGCLVLLVGIFLVGARVYKKNQAEEVSAVIAADTKIFVPEYSVRKGNPDAKVTVVEFFDPECESCREFHPYMKEIMQMYEGKIQVVMRYAPFHGNSIFAIKILEAARKQGKYWETLEILFKHQPEWGDHHEPRPELIWTFLPLVHLDSEKIKADMESPDIMYIIQQDQQALESLQVKGTPTFFVNEKKIDEFGPGYLRQAIDDALKAVSN